MNLDNFKSKTIITSRELSPQENVNLVILASKFESDIFIGKNSYNVVAKSLLGVTALGLRYGDELTIFTKGEDEDIALEDICKFLDFT